MDAVAVALAAAADPGSSKRATATSTYQLWALYDAPSAVDPDDTWLYLTQLNNTTFRRIKVGTVGGGSDSETLAPVPFTVDQGTAAAFRVKDGVHQFWIRGGSSSSDKDLYVYDVASNTWTQKALMTVYARGINGFVWHEARDEFYSISDANSSFWVYNVATNTWSMPAAENGNFGLAYAPDTGLIHGVGAAHSAPRSDHQVYDPVAGTWTAKAAAPGTFLYHALGSVAGTNELVLIAGGLSTASNTYRRLTHIYDMATNTWSDGPPIVNARARGGAAVSRTTVYMTGGLDTGSAILNTVEGIVYIPTTDNTPAVKTLFSYLASR